MTSEQEAGMALTAVGLVVFSVLLRLRARKAAGNRRRSALAPGGSLEAVKALFSPSGERVAVVLAGAPFDDPVDRAVETGLWWLLWMLPARLCRIEVWVFDVPAPVRGAPSALGEILARTPVAQRLIWRGQGHPRQADGVELAWTGPGELQASFRGTSHRIEVG